MNEWKRAWRARSYDRRERASMKAARARRERQGVRRTLRAGGEAPRRQITRLDGWQVV